MADKQPGGFKKFLGAAFPFIATAASAGGPLGSMAAAAVGKALGLDKPPDTNSLQSVIANAAMSGEQVEKLKEAEMDFQKSLAEMNIDSMEKLEAIAAGDRDSARKREETLGDWTPRVLAYLIVAAFLAVVFYVLSGKSTIEGALAGTLIGYVSAKAEQVVTYYFGSSAGSDRKTELLAQAPSVSK